MKLRVRVNKFTSRLELDGEDPTLTELCIHVKEILLPSCGISPEAEFTLSLNGSEPLSNIGQTLSLCGVVSGDLISVILPQSGPAPSPAAPSTPSPAVSSTHSPAASSGPQPAQPVHGSSSAISPGRLHEENRRSELAGGSGVNMSDSEQDPEADIEEEQEMEPGPFKPGPMLCSESEEGEVPHSLEVLHHGVQSQSPCDSLVVATHLLMMETGFIPEGTDERPGEMPAGWRAAGGVYRLQYAHPLCEHSLAVMVAVPMGNMLVINATLKLNEAMENARKLLLKTSSYVTDEWAGENAALVYRDLKKLSRVFKDQLAYPLIASARQAMNLPAVFGLTALPPELLLRILRLLDAGSVVALSGTCRDLHCASADPSLWRHMYQRDFRDPTNRPMDTDWKALYKKKYKQRREAARFRRTRLFPPIPPYQPTPYHPFPFGPHPPYPPGIIGGGYDQRPGIPRPRFDPISPHQGHSSGARGRVCRRTGNRSSDIRRGFI